MGQAWYYTQGGQQVGPVEWVQLQQMAGAGQIGAMDLVWTDGMAQWTAASAIPGLMPAAAPVGASPYGGAPSPYGAAPTPYGNPSLNYYSPQPGQLAYAGFWLRFVAVLLDGLICSVVVVPIVLGVAFSMGTSNSAQIQGMNYGLQFLIFVLAWPYFALQESSAAQATLGKRALGLIVTDMNGQRINFGQASGRYFGKLVSQIICYIGYMLAGWTQQKQALHDIMASTLVMRKT